MCSYKYEKKRNPLENKPCIYPEIYERLHSHFKISKSLPIDKKGYCIFHSRDIEWKYEQEFVSMFHELMKVLLETNGSKARVTCNFSGFYFCDINKHKIIIDNYAHSDLDFTYCEFINRFGIINSNLSGVDFSHSLFHEAFNLDKVNFVNNVDFKYSIFNGFEITNCEFKELSEFSNCTFQNVSKSVDCKFRLSDSRIEEMISFKNSTFDSSVYINKVFFKSETGFQHCKFNDEFYFHDCEINDAVNFHETEFLLSENANPRYSSVDFRKLNIKKYGVLSFKGKYPMDDMVRAEMDITSELLIEGLIAFENFNLNKINPYDKIKLLELEKAGRVEIRKGCMKYYCQTDILTIEASNSNQKLILDIINVFCNYFEVQNHNNLGIEIVERTKALIKYFYFTDEKISKENFIERIQHNERSLWETFSNLTNHASLTLSQNDNEIKNCLIDLAGFFLKIGNQIEHKNLNEQELKNMLGSLSTSGVSILDVGKMWKEIMSRWQNFNNIAPRIVILQLDKNISDLFVHPSRIDELKNIENDKFDLSKLIKMCEELNISFSNDANFGSAFLIRSIMDHVPPIFGEESFITFANNCKGSFKKSMINLQNSARNISDRLIHSKISISESLPNSVQVDFRNDLDVLLEQVVKVLK